MIDLVIDQRRKDLGGFEVGRVLPFAKRRMIGPFIFFDHMGPAQFQAGFGREVDVRPHPHIGLSTLSYLFEGEMTHRDSVGVTQPIRPGEVNWMTAGSGITHSERFETLREKGGRMNGIQTWIALPVEDEEMAPAFNHYSPDVLPTHEEKGMWARLIAGQAFGASSPVKTHSPMFYVHWHLNAGARAQLPPSTPSARPMSPRAWSRLTGASSTRARCWSSSPASRSCSRRSATPSSCCWAASRSAHA